jgi:hypothetical protein
MSFGEYPRTKMTRFYRSGRTIPADARLPDHEALEPAADRVEIPLNYTAISLGFSALLLAFAGAWWGLFRNSWLSVVILASGAAFVGYLLGRMLMGRGPGLILSAAGVSVRKGLGDVLYLPWSQATTVELKSAMVQLLVIGMRNPQNSLANARGYRGWVMRRKQRNSAARSPSRSGCCGGTASGFCRRLPPIDADMARPSPARPGQSTLMGLRAAC